MADLTIKFKGNPIVEMTESGTKTLKTAGKYCEDDIKVEYAKSATGGGTVPKPLTYDYMPEGYPTKAMETVTVMEEQELAFVSEGGSPYMASLTEALELVEGQTYTVNWDGTEYERVCSFFNGKTLVIGNTSIYGAGADTGEPFLYIASVGAFFTLDTSASHTISVKTTQEIVTPMAVEFLPAVGQLIVVVYNTNLAGTKFAADKTYDEISAAIESGMSVVIHKKENINEVSYEVFHHNQTGRGFYRFCSVKYWEKIEVSTISIRMVGGEMAIDIRSKEIQAVTS